MNVSSFDQTAMDFFEINRSGDPALQEAGSKQTLLRPPGKPLGLLALEMRTWRFVAGVFCAVTPLAEILGNENSEDTILRYALSKKDDDVLPFRQDYSIAARTSSSDTVANVVAKSDIPKGMISWRP